jgi:hypothetical protein
MMKFVPHTERRSRPVCEILVRCKDDPDTGNIVFDVGVWKSGYIVHVAPDGWSWGECELGSSTYTDANPASPTFGQKLPMSGHPRGNHNFWRIFKFPGLPTSIFNGYLATQPAMVNGAAIYPRIRANYVDFTLLSAAAQAYVADDTRTQPSFTISGANAISIAAFIKPTPVTAAAIGPSPSLIG